MSLIDEILEKAKNDDTFRGTQIVSYLIGYIEGESVSYDDKKEKMIQLTKFIREINIYDSLSD